jgi:hypothetical protein
MLGSLHLPHLDLGPGMLALILLGAGAVLAVAVLLIVAGFRRAGSAEVTNALWGGALVLAGAMLAAVLIEHPAGSGPGGDRRAIERQAAELTARAIAPGSALACLDSVPTVVADACETAVFAKPEAVAAAVDYVDAKLLLLAASVALAERDPGLEPLVERLRGAIEADRYGLVAHVLTTRGCAGPGCADLKLLRDPSRVVANMTARAFEARLGAHVLAWQGGSGPTNVAALPPGTNALPPMAAIGSNAASSAPPATSGAASSGRIEFPSAASIPPVSIMTPEPSAPPAAAEPKPAPAKRASPPPRRQSVGEHPPVPPPAPRRQATQQRAAAPPPAQPAAPAPPQQIAPPPPETAAPPEPPQGSGLP